VKPNSDTSATADAVSNEESERMACNTSAAGPDYAEEV
jgi:hypothetical protein